MTTSEELERELRLQEEKQILMAELLSMPRDLKAATIKAATEYRSGNDRCNSVYMGGMAHAMLVRALGGRYGHSLYDDLLAAATDAQIDAALDVCSSYIAFMRKNPVAKCPCCGAIVPAKEAGGSAQVDAQKEAVPATNIRSFLDCSTRHLSPDTLAALNEIGTQLDRLPFAGGVTAYGWFAYACEEEPEDGIQPDLWAVMQHARSLGCEYILFDSDAPEVDGLPVYDHG